MIHSTDIPNPWHGESSPMRPNMTFEEKIDAAGFNYQVERSPIFYLAGDEPKQAEDRFAYFRQYDVPDHPRQGEFEAVMSGQFKPCQPAEMMRFYERLERETGCPLHVAGTLHGGTFFATAKIDRTASDAAWEVAGEKHRRYWLIASRNDGTMSNTWAATDVQTVCENTMRMALSRGDVVKVNHRSKVDWGQVRAQLDAVRGDFPAFDGFMELLKDVSINPEYAADFIPELVAPKWDRTDPEQVKKMPRTVTKLSESVLYAPGQKERGATAYGLLSGVTHYVDHNKQARSAENLLCPRSGVSGSR
jgi:phage/plasmid-like protein (TIGR03299 family)